MSPRPEIHASRFPAEWAERCGRPPVGVPEAMREWIITDIKQDGGETRRTFDEAPPIERRVAATLSEPATRMPAPASSKSTPTRVVGVVCPFDSPAVIADTFTEVYDRGAFRDQEAKGWKDTGPSVLGLWNHDRAAPIASVASGTLKLKTTGRGVEFDMTPVPAGVGEYALQLVARGDVAGSSAGFVVWEDVWTHREGDRYPHCTILRARLMECSLTTWPAYKAATAQARAVMSSDEFRADTRGQALRDRMSRLDAGNLHDARTRHRHLGRRWGSGPKDGR